MADQDDFRSGLANIANARIEDGFTGEDGELQQIIEHTISSLRSGRTRTSGMASA